MTPDVSVLVTAYNQGPYVSEALASVLAQRLDATLEVIVGVDASGDETAEVVRGFARAHPGRLRILEQNRRVGLIENARTVFAAAGGRFLALLEGDDIWLDTGKLARQLEVLGRADGPVLVAHRTEQVDADGARLASIPGVDYPESVPSSLFVERECDVHTSSLLFRNLFPGGLPAPLLDRQVGVYDLPLKLALAGRGNIAYIPETMSRFRRVPGSASSAHDDRMWHDVIRRSFENTRRLLPPELRRVADRKIAGYAAAAAVERERPRGERAVMALLALRRGPRRALDFWARGAYGRLPEGAKGAYRRARGRQGGGDG